MVTVNQVTVKPAAATAAAPAGARARGVLRARVYDDARDFELGGRSRAWRSCHEVAAAAAGARAVRRHRRAAFATCEAPNDARVRDAKRNDETIQNQSMCMTCPETFFERVVSILVLVE